MAGIPPLLGFFSKQFVLYSAIQSGYYFMSIVCIIVSVISASYYLKIIRVLHTESDKSNLNTTLLQTPSSLIYNPQGYVVKTSNDQENIILSNSHSFLISTLTLAILFFVLKPSILLNSTKLLSLSLFYY